MRRALRLSFLFGTLALFALVPIASATHDSDNWFAGEWKMVFPDEPSEGPLRLRSVDEATMRRELADEGFRSGSWLAGNCTRNARTQWYVGSAKRGPDSGPIVACTNSGSGQIHAIFKSMYKVEVAISWPRGNSALASSFNLPNGPVDHWNIFLVKHFSGDGTQIKEHVSKLVINADAGDTAGGSATLTVRWFVFVSGSGSPVFNGYGRLRGKNPAKLESLDLGSPYNVITWRSARGETTVEVTGGSYTSLTRGDRTVKTVILKVKVFSSAIPSCKKGTTGTVRLFLAGAGSSGPDATVTRNVCGQEHWDTTR